MFYKFNCFLFVVFLETVSGGRHDLYSGYSVHCIKLQSREDQKFLHDAELTWDLDIWQHGSPGLRDALAMVAPGNAHEFLYKLDEYSIPHSLHVSDVAELLEKEDNELSQWRNRKNGKMVPFEDYPTYAEVDAYLEKLAVEYPDLVQIVNVGKSYEGRDIKYLKISTTNFTDTSKPIYFLDATIHAREWVTTPVALYSIHRLVEELRSDDVDLLDIDWIVMPIVNPDGFEYTHTAERLWRRTRSINLINNSTCIGVDANRNFDVSFNTIGVTSYCSNNYPGPTAFSEVETQYVRDIMHQYLDRIQLYMNVHSQGNWVLFAYGNSSLPDNVVQLHHVGSAMGAAIDDKKLPEALYYTVGNSALLLYETSGSAQDYAQLIGIPLSYTLELPGLGFGHVVPPSYIEQINMETWEGIAASARLAKLFWDARKV